MIFNDERIYKTLKKILMYVFPAILFVWDRLVEIWSIPYGTQISGTIFALYVGLAIFLGVSKSKYNNALNGYLGDGKGDDADDLLDIDESGMCDEE